MPLTNGVHTVIHPATDADTTKFVYTEIYAGADATPTINGVSVAMAAGSSLDIAIATISATANIYVLGEPRSTYEPPTIFGK